MEYINLIIENWDTILIYVNAIFGGIVGLMTIVNKFAPGTVSDSVMGKLVAATDKFSVGTKRTQVIKE
jgi:hypothetical protein